MPSFPIVRSSTCLIIYSFLSLVARRILFECRLEAEVEKKTTPKKLLLLRVLITLIAAYLTSRILFPSIEVETSMIKTTFFAPEIAAVYQGRNLGS